MHMGFRSLPYALAVGLLMTATSTAPATAQSLSSDPANFLNLSFVRWAPIGTWYATFLIDGAPAGVNLPALLTFHRDWTFSAVDGGDFGAIPELPFNQLSQHGVWRWAGGQKFVATGMILSFKREAGMEGQLDSVSRTVIEIEFKNNFDEFTAVVSQDYWFCPDSFSCPDPLNAPPDLTVPAEGSGFSILARRLKPM